MVLTRSLIDCLVLRVHDRPSSSVRMLLHLHHLSTIVLLLTHGVFFLAAGLFSTSILLDSVKTCSMATHGSDHRTLVHCYTVVFFGLVPHDQQHERVPHAHVLVCLATEGVPHRVALMVDVADVETLEQRRSVTISSITTGILSSVSPRHRVGAPIQGHRLPP
jgi:hypothetical protein